MGYLVGVDGGGTGCRAVVADEGGKGLGRAEGGPANIATDLQSARANILGAVDAAFTAAGIPVRAVANAAAVLGLAGSNLGDYRAQLLAALPFAKANIVSDAQTTLVGAIGNAEGCVAAIGTGSVFARQDDASGFTQLGGWGFLLGDDGSGARLGQDILHRSLLAHDGLIPHSPLTLEILTDFNQSPSQMVERAKRFTPGEFGRFAPQVVAAAKAGDINAEHIMAHHTEIVRLSIEATGFAPGKAFCMLGGLGPIYLERLDGKYKRAAKSPLGNALDGAVILAKRLTKTP